MFEFDDARRHALESDLARVRRGLPSDLLQFDAVRDKLRLRHSVDRGLLDVPLDRIVGSLGRDRDFNRLFFPRGESLRGRWEVVRKLALGDQGFPSVEVYKVGDAYFVIDGHHRVSVARHLGAPSIEAYVREFVTDVPVEPDDSLEALALRRGRADFLEATGIDVDATELDAYERLLDHISVHGWHMKIAWTDAVASWREHVYGPMIAIIHDSGVMEQFPGRTETDLYLYAMDHLYFLREREGDDAHPAAAVEEMKGKRASNAVHAIWIFLLCMVVYNANLRFTGSNDSLASSILPFQIWRGEGLDLTDWATKLPRQVGYSMIPSKHGGWVSAYPLTTSLVVLPLYSPAAVWPRFDPRDAAYGSLIRVVMEKFAASVVASLSVVFVFLILKRLYTPRTVTLLTIAYAFGTSVWAISSQALWQHGVAQLLIAAAVFLLITDPEPHGRRAFLLGLIAGLVTANRPPDLFFSIAIAWIVLRRSGRRAWPFFAAAFIVAALLLIYNATTFPTILGGYAEMRTNHNMGEPLRMEWPRLDRLAGQFFSNRGLFFFFPFLLVLAFLPKPRGRAREEAIVFAAAFLSSAIFYSCFFWWPAGYCYGPRYLTDALPWLFVYVGAAVDALRTSWSRLAVATAVAYSVFLQAIGAFCYPGGDSGNKRHGLWTIARSSPVVALQSGLQSPYFVYDPNPLPAASALTKTTFDQPVPATWRTGETRLLRVNVRNEGARSVSSIGGLFAVGAVRLLVRWQPISRQTDNWLAWDLDPGESKEKCVFVRAPNEAGDYVLTIEPAQYEGGRLVPFSEHGSAPAIARVRVVEE